MISCKLMSFSYLFKKIREVKKKISDASETKMNKFILCFSQITLSSQSNKKQYKNEKV